MMDEPTNSTDPASALPCAPDSVDAFLSVPEPKTVALLSDLEGDILVLGAGGKMGLHLCLLLRRALDEAGSSNRVYAASRFTTLNSARSYVEAGIETIAGDFRDDAFVDSLPDCPVVFFLAGAKFGTSGNPRVLQEANVEVPDRIAKRFKESRIVAFSTGCVYSYTTPESGGSREDSPTNPVGEYAQSCLERERRFEAVSEQFGTEIVLIRLNYSLEFRYGVLHDIGQSVLSDEPIDLTMGYVNLIWQNDALNQIVRCLELVASPAVPINITGPDIISVKDIAQRFGERLGREPRFTSETAESMWLSDASRSHERFGRPSVDWETMVDWVAAWLLAGGDSYGKPTGFQKRDGKF